MKVIILIISIGIVCSSFCSGPTLKQELNQAEHELMHAEQKVLRLREALAREEVARIEQQLTNTGAAADLDKHKFVQEREILSQIIHTHPSLASDAQDVLNKILIFLTDFYDAQGSSV